MSLNATPATAATITRTIGPKFAVMLLSACALLVSLLGPGWLFVPANPTTGAHATTLNFGDLHELTSGGIVPTNALQTAYFGWLGWTLALSVIVLSVAALTARQRLVGGLAPPLAVAGLVFTTLGVKGPLTWPQLMDQVSNVRVGGYLAAVGYLLAAGLAVAITGRRHP
jgi:hypothetical protein